MLSVLNTSYSISRDLTVVVGLKMIDDGKFESRIGVSFNSEKVIFSHQEWKTFLIISIKELGANECFLDDTHSDLKLQNHQVMLNMTNDVNEIVVKSLVSWNTVRINQQQIEKISDLQHCIGNYVKFIEGYVEYANYCFNKLINDIHQEMIKVMNESYALYAECAEMKLMVPHPPKIKEKDIRNELKKKICGDRMTNEIILFYDSRIVTIIINRF